MRQRYLIITSDCITSPDTDPLQWIARVEVPFEEK